MAAYETPRPPAKQREMRAIMLKFNGRSPDRYHAVKIPADMPLPDLITYRGHMFAMRGAGVYAEATIWPIVDDLDAST